MTNDMTKAYCLDQCGNVLHTDYEIIGGICMQCLNGVTLSDTNTQLWETETTAAWEDEDGIDEDEKLCMIINAGLASIWPSPVFDEKPIDTSNFITVTKGQAWFAVEFWWNTEEDFVKPGEGFWEPWQTGSGRYATPEEAAVEAQAWAIETGTRYVERNN